MQVASSLHAILCLLPCQAYAGDPPSRDADFPNLARPSSTARLLYRPAALPSASCPAEALLLDCFVAQVSPPSHLLQALRRGWTPRVSQGLSHLRAFPFGFRLHSWPLVRDHPRPSLDFCIAFGLSSSRLGLFRVFL